MITERWIHKFQIKPGVWVYVPSTDTTEYGLDVKNRIEQCWNAPKYYHHLKNGSHIKALSTHLHNTIFIHLDIKNFFQSVNKSKITRCLKTIMPYEEAREIATQSTVKQRNSFGTAYCLPFGFVQSPILASLCLRQSKLGSLLDEIHQTKKYAVSVYMDDIIISHVDKSELSNIQETIIATAQRSRFPLNTEKEQGPSETVTAFNINLSHNSLEIIQQRMDVFEEAYKHANNEYVRAGILGYIESVNQSQLTQITT